MEVAGLCALCGAPGVLRTCALCGRTVCATHFDHASGACTNHARPGPGTPHGVR